MHKFLIYFLTIILFNTLSGVNSLVFAENSVEYKLENKGAEEKEESGESTSEFNLQKSARQISVNFEYSYEEMCAYALSNLSNTDSYCTTAFLKLFVLYEQYLI